MPTINLPLKIDEDINAFTLPSERLQEQIMDIEKVNNIPNHNQIFVHLKNGYEVSILQGPFTFWLFEIAVKKNGELLDYFYDGDDQIYRTNVPEELVQIMEDVSYL